MTLSFRPPKRRFATWFLAIAVAYSFFIVTYVVAFNRPWYVLLFALSVLMSSYGSAQKLFLRTDVTQDGVRIRTPNFTTRAIARTEIAGLTKAGYTGAPVELRLTSGATMIAPGVEASDIPAIKELLSL